MNLNTLSTGDQGVIWIPEVIFSNTLDKEESKRDNKAYVTVDRRGEFKTSSIQSRFSQNITLSTFVRST